MSGKVQASVWFLSFGLFVGSCSSELHVYPDAYPGKRMGEVSLKELAEFLSSKAAAAVVGSGGSGGIAPSNPGIGGAFRWRAHLPAAQKKHLLDIELARQKEKSIIEALTDGSNVGGILAGRKPSSESRMNGRMKLPRELLPIYNRPTDPFEPFDLELYYPRLNDPDAPDAPDTPPLNTGQRLALPSNFPRSRPRPRLQQLDPETATFTFRFDANDLRNTSPFAVRPNDPRYYEEDLEEQPEDEEHEEHEEQLEEIESKGKVDTVSESLAGGGDLTMERTDDEDEVAGDEEEENGYDRKTSPIYMCGGKENAFPGGGVPASSELERHAGCQQPLVVPINRNLDNDIYFVAIVAGCSAAAMFALVLITLTWCRLQRGAKAAADIEYPAYGVTGPNKDVSPSGDQRLAQSAQMYHFQHQKQQIISMENRSSATRDPGSVSEAESDEENEEGDYTVYECPGLAPTGEMEVKNPLFHDDPTPATPLTTGQSSEQEDHHS